MQVFSPVYANDRVLLPADNVCDVFKAVGTDGYGKACFQMLEQSLNVDHWALFHYRAFDAVRCIATASRVYNSAAEENINTFVSKCYRVDPSLSEVKRRPVDQTCVVKMEANDIKDRQYRNCFELTRVNERLSFFARFGSDLVQLSVYSGFRRRSFSAVEVSQFAALANLIVASSSKHEMLWDRLSVAPGYLDLAAIELRLAYIEDGLSDRERQVCARAAAGKTIEETAIDLGIERTSVITYRQRAYRKLGISRQNELVALISNMRVSALPSYGTA